MCIIEGSRGEICIIDPIIEGSRGEICIIDPRQCLKKNSIL